MPLIYGEIRIQRIILEALRSQLSHYIKLVSFPEDQHILIPDTNVYIHGRLFHEVDWHREIGARRATLLMPLVVLDELDRVKDRDLTYGKRAGAVLRALDKLFKDSEWLAPKILRQGVSLQMVDEPLGHTRQLGQDDEIVRQASYFSQLNKNRLTVLTRDRGMRLRAQASGLIGKSLPVHLERIKEKDDE
jgi:predicted ribonuclease YlaK